MSFAQARDVGVGSKCFAPDFCFCSFIAVLPHTVIIVYMLHYSLKTMTVKKM